MRSLIRGLTTDRLHVVILYGTAVLGALAVLYVIIRATVYVDPTGPVGPSETARSVESRFAIAEAERFAPDTGFKTGAAEDIALQAFQGKVILVNAWATWCTPCLAELPALDRLEGELGGDDFQVVAISIDRAGRKKSQEMLDRLEIQNLNLYYDEDLDIGYTMEVTAVPTTILYGRDGREIGRLIGDAVWDADDAKRLIRRAIRDGGLS